MDRAVLSLKTQRRRLEDHRTRVMSQINREKVIARELVATGHKDRAILALKKKRLQETTLIKLDAWLLNVESMVSKFHQLALPLLYFAQKKRFFNNTL